MSCLFRPPAAVTAVVFTLVSLCATSPPASATVILSGSGVSAAGNPVAASATLDITGDTLTLKLANTSPVDTQATADVLSSFYFDIVNGGLRPAMTLVSGSGYVWQMKKNAADVPINYTPPAMAGGSGSYVSALANPPHTLSDLLAVKDGDRTWQFRSMDVSLAPFEGFGLGTVGNSVFSPNGFDPAIVGPPGNGQIAFGLYTGSDIQPVGKPMMNQYLVRNEATFTFSGLTGFTEADIVPATFGFGTGPDSTITLPEPGTGVMALAGLVASAALLGWRRQARTLSIGMAAAGSLAVAILFSPVAHSAPVVLDDAFDFTVGHHDWQPMAVGMFYPPPPDKQWKYADGQWSVKWSPVNGPLVATGNYLTSPSMQVSQKFDGIVDLIRISIAHEFNFGSSTNGIPPAAGQLAFSINGGSFQGLPLSSFQAGLLTDTNVPFTPPIDAIPTGLVNQLDLVQPSFASPGGSGYPSLLPLINDGATFVGTSPNYGTEGGWFVPSIATISIPPTVIQSFQLRLISANLGSECMPSDTWNVRYVQTDFAAMPEPGGMALAGCGAGLAAAWTALARRQKRPLAEPSPADRAGLGHQLPSPLKA
jgi:hypothetical protein